MIEVLHPGLLTTIQDAGRKGFEEYGVPPSGAFDPFLAAVANHLVGNPPLEPLLEFALVGPRLRFSVECWVAVAGFDVRYKCGDELIPEFSAFLIPAGGVLAFETMAGWFGYLAVAGSFLTDHTLGSASSYVAGRMGVKIGKGSLLKQGAASGTFVRIRKQNLGMTATNVVSILPAYHTSQFSAHERQKLAEHWYLVSPQSNRMGIRLDGAAIDPPEVVRSVPALPGAIQIPRAGKPIILGPEGPTTGGYAQIAILSQTSWTQLASVRPGSKIRFEWIDKEAAIQKRKYRNAIFESKDAWERI